MDQLRVEIYPDRPTLGLAAARAVAQAIKAKLERQKWISIIFASAPSQDEFLAALATQSDFDWQRIIVFQMDEYINLPSHVLQNFGQYLRQRLFGRVKPGMVHYLDGNALDLSEEMGRYSTLLRQYPPDITCAGIGENGHLAFNDPPVADFEDEALVKIVELTERSRLQQVNDGCFDRLEQVPQQALTLTIPALLAAPLCACMVPARSKAQAVRQMLAGPISPDCPASILRQHPHTVLYLEPESAALI